MFFAESLHSPSLVEAAENSGEVIQAAENAAEAATCRALRATASAAVHNKRN